MPQQVREQGRRAMQGASQAEKASHANSLIIAAWGQFCDHHQQG